MPNGNVGAGILNIITESLYDRPIVVFREYVQNSIDSFKKLENEIAFNELHSKIWREGNNLIFLDNGNGISQNEFLSQMTSIAYSGKNRVNNIGYKGIGRLSGLPYCKKLYFVNICSFKNKIFQQYIVDGEKYLAIKGNMGIADLKFEDIMMQIGEYTESLSDKELNRILLVLKQYEYMFENRDKGFLVLLEDINYILNRTITKDDFKNELGWLLPVKFNDELFDEKSFTLNEHLLFKDLVDTLPESPIIPAQSFNIWFNDIQIERPLRAYMLRDYTCKVDYLKYAVGFHTFNHDKIQISQKNIFSGIKLYIDNMLLCDENELIPILQQYGLISHSANELIQTVKGIGALIYITDKVDLYANARRTFIEVTDEDSFNFLRILADFVDSIYEARYSLSKYSTRKNNFEQSSEKLEQLKQTANAALQRLARDVIKIELEENSPTEFKDLSTIEQKRAIKKKLMTYTSEKIGDYLLQTSTYDYEHVINDFKIWFQSNM